MPDPTTSTARRAGASGYDGVAKTLHWTIAALVLVMLIFGGADDGLERTAWEAEFEGHAGLGLVVLVLMAMRLAWRAGHPPPPMSPTMAAWQRRAALGMHRLFYVLLILQPLLGMAAAGAHGFDVRAFGMVSFSGLLGRDQALADVLVGVHSLNATVLLVLIAGHAGFALYHHLALGDDVLRRMLPGARRRESP